jgi:hypothetical protein
MAATTSVRVAVPSITGAPKAIFGSSITGNCLESGHHRSARSVLSLKDISSRYLASKTPEQICKSRFFVSSTISGSSMPRTSSAKIVFPAEKTRRVAKGCAVLKSAMARSAAILTRCKEIPRSRKLLTTRSSINSTNESAIAVHRGQINEHDGAFVSLYLFAFFSYLVRISLHPTIQSCGMDL